MRDQLRSICQSAAAAGFGPIEVIGCAPPAYVDGSRWSPAVATVAGR